MVLAVREGDDGCIIDRQEIERAGGIRNRTSVAVTNRECKSNQAVEIKVWRENIIAIGASGYRAFATR